MYSTHDALTLTATQLLNTNVPSKKIKCTQYEKSV